MESRGRTEINIGIGQVGSNPGISFNLDILIGQGNTSKLKHEIHAKTGHQFEDYHGYILIPANSEESAHALQHILEGVWNKALSGEPSDQILQAIKEKIKPNDDEEPMFHLDFSVHGKHLVVKVSGNEMNREMIQGSIGMATGFVGPILEHDQNIHVEFDVEKSIGEIFNSENPIMTGFNSMKFNVILGVNTALSSHGASIAENFGAPPQVLHALGLLGLYENANIDLKFLSAERLPSQVTDAINELNSGAMLQMGKEMAPDHAKEMVRKIGEHFDGEIQVVAGFSSVMVQVKIHVPGLFHVYN